MSNIFSEIGDKFLSEGPITPYDRAHMAIYLSLLHASGEGMSLEEMASKILGLDPETGPKNTRTIVENHLARARWLATSGYKLLLESEADTAAGRSSPGDKASAS